MPQLVVNMNDNTQNKISRNLKRNRLKKRHAPYLPVGRQVQTDNTIKAKYTWV
jgi:hypothetical protein